MKVFLRKNLMIVVSITLPLLLVIFFALASLLPGLYTTPPAYDVLISLQDRSSSRATPVKIQFAVRSGQLKAIVFKSEQAVDEYAPRLFRYSQSTAELQEVSIPIPENLAELSQGYEISIPALAGLKVSDTLKAPDGYEFRGRTRGGGLMTELFAGERSRTDVSIAKNGVVIRIRLPSSNARYNEVRLAGWIIGQKVE